MQNPGKYVLAPETFFALASGTKTPCPPPYPVIMSRSVAAHETWTIGPSVSPHAARILVHLGSWFRFSKATVRYNTVRYDTVRYDIVAYGTVRYGIVSNLIIEISMVWYNGHIG